MDRRWWEGLAISGAMWWDPWAMSAILRASAQEPEGVSYRPPLSGGSHPIRDWWERRRKLARSASVASVPSAGEVGVGR